MSPRPRRTPAARQRGLAIVEFTLILPIVLILLLATAEFGRALYQYNTIVKSARDGIRYLAARGPTLGNSDVINTVTLTTASNLALCGKTVCAPGEEVVPGLAAQGTITPSYSGDFVVLTMSIVYPYRSITGTALSALGVSNLLGVNLRANVTMRNLQLAAES